MLGKNGSTAAILHGNDGANTKGIWKTAPFLIGLSPIIASAVVALSASCPWSRAHAAWDWDFQGKGRLLMPGGSLPLFSE